jgi:hypothetical protein
VVTEDNGKQNNNRSRYPEKQRPDQKETSLSSQRICETIAKNYEMIQGAHIANSFILLLALSKATEPLSTTQISEIISKKSRGEIFKLSSTLKDSLEYRLKRDGYVEGIDMKKKSVYSIDLLRN